MFKDIENLLQKSCRMLVVGGFLCASGMATAQSITRMRCEYGVRPLCIDVSAPDVELPVEKRFTATTVSRSRWHRFGATFKREAHVAGMGFRRGYL